MEEALSFPEARRLVLAHAAARPDLGMETVPLPAALGRVVAAAIAADRDYPPVARSIRDGFAVRAEDLPGGFEIVGEVRAGEHGTHRVGLRQAVEIMTGAPMPDGADTVVMVEHAARSGPRLETARVQKPGEFVNPAASEARAGEVLLGAGEWITFPRIALLATLGYTEVPVYRKPAVAILSTGDEVVAIGAAPEPYQVRNSNASSLAAQVARAGGEPHILPVAPDRYEPARAAIEAGLDHDLLLLSGGVSAGKYDIVEQVLADLGARFHFTRVLIQPGQPVVFGSVGEKLFFGLPGNPASTMVCFEIFARAAVERLAGRKQASFPLSYARLTHEFRHKSGLTRFLPASLDPEGLAVTPVRWQGSSDVPALARANCFLMADAACEVWPAGEWIPILPI